MPARPITIADIHYPTRTAIECRLKQTLHAGDENDEIMEAAETALLSALFYARASKVAELEGRTVTGWGRERNSANICFAALCGDGTRLHFSFGSSLDALYARQGEK